MDNISELEQMQKDKRKQWLKTDKEAKEMVEELYKIDYKAFDSDMKRVKRAVVKAMNNIARNQKRA